MTPYLFVTEPFLKCIIFRMQAKCLKCNYVQSINFILFHFYHIFNLIYDVIEAVDSINKIVKYCTIKLVGIISRICSECLKALFEPKCEAKGFCATMYDGKDYWSHAKKNLLKSNSSIGKTEIKHQPIIVVRASLSQPKFLEFCMLYKKLCK